MLIAKSTASGHSVPLSGRNSTYRPVQILEAGSGIIDLVNAYVQVALNSGLVGLGLFASFFASILFGLWRVIRIHGRRDIEVTNCARILLALLVAILVTIGTVSSIGFILYVYWSFAGLSVALIRISSRQRAPTVAHAAHMSGLRVEPPFARHGT